MQSVLSDINRIRNLSTKNAFVAHEASHRAWKSLTLLCSEEDLATDGFKENFKFSSKPPSTEKWCVTPSIEDSDYSSFAPTVHTRVIDEEDDATSPAIASLHRDSASGPSAPPNSNVDPAATTSTSPPPGDV
jgi:hypothetical protein